MSDVAFLVMPVVAIVLAMVLIAVQLSNMSSRRINRDLIASYERKSTAFEELADARLRWVEKLEELIAAKDRQIAAQDRLISALQSRVDGS